MNDSTEELSSIIIEASPLDNPRVRFLFYAIIALCLALLQVLVVSLMSVDGTTPDLLFIFAAWVALAEGRLTGIIVAFIVGVLYDVLSADILGSNALAKVVSIFIVGTAFKEKKQQLYLGTYRFPLLVTIGGLFHNIIYFFFYLDPVETPFWMFFLRYGVAATLYTTVLSIIPMLIVGRRRDWS